MSNFESNPKCLVSSGWSCRYRVCMLLVSTYGFIDHKPLSGRHSFSWRSSNALLTGAPRSAFAALSPYTFIIRCDRVPSFLFAVTKTHLVVRFRSKYYARISALLASRTIRSKFSIRVACSGMYEHSAHGCLCVFFGNAFNCARSFNEHHS